MDGIVDGRRRRHLLPLQIPDRDRAHPLRHAGDLDRPVPRRRRRPATSRACSAGSPQFLALTGARLDGAECFALGLATHYIPSDGSSEVKADDRQRSRAGRGDPRPRARHRAAAGADRRQFATRSTAASPPTRLEDILAALEADGSDWALKELATLRAQIADRLQGLAPPARREPEAIPFRSTRCGMEYALIVRMSRAIPTSSKASAPC